MSALRPRPLQQATTIRPRALVRVLRLEGTVSGGRGGQPGSSFSFEKTRERIARAFFVPPLEDYAGAPATPPDEWFYRNSHLKRTVMDRKGEMVDRLLAMNGVPSRPDAVAVVINCPGGSPVQSHLIHDALVDAKERSGIPLVAFVEDVGASGGYLIACAADEIVAAESSIVGSVGVIGSSFGLDQAIEKLGITRRVVTAGTRKALNDPFMPQDARMVATQRQSAQEMHHRFISVVKRGRGETLGRVFQGTARVGECLAHAQGASSQWLVKPAGESFELGGQATHGGDGPHRFCPADWSVDAQPYESVDDLLQGDVFVGNTAVHFGFADAIGRFDHTMQERCIRNGLAQRPEQVLFDFVRPVAPSLGEIFSRFSSEASIVSDVGRSFAAGVMSELQASAAPPQSEFRA
jgi:ClpP class serine protease